MPNTKASVVYINYLPVPLGAADVMHTMKMCQAYQQLGMEVTLVAPQGDTSQLDTIWTQYGVRHPFEMKLYPNWKWSRRHTVFLRGVFLARRTPKPVIVHTRSAAAALYAAIAGIPTIYETHSPLASRMERPYVWWLSKLPAFKKLIAVTTPIQKGYQDFVPSIADKIIVMNNGVDLDQFEPPQHASQRRKALGLKDNFTVGYIGSLFAGRGIEIILQVAPKMPHIEFLVVGGTTKDIEQWQRQADTNLPNITLRTAVPNHELPQFMQAADVLLMPYQREVAVFGSKTANSVDYMNPMKMYEYMAARRLIISSDLPMIRAVLTDDMAILCPPDDVAAWQNAIEAVYQSPPQFERHLETSYQFIRENTWQHRVQRILQDIIPDNSKASSS